MKYIISYMNFCYNKFIYIVGGFIVSLGLVLTADEDIRSKQLWNDENLLQQVSSQLDEIPSDKLNISNYSNYESKGSALQKILSLVTFICAGRYEGYYADMEFGCQIFHYCKQNGLRFTFVCPSNSIFNQKEMICDHNSIDPIKQCQKSPEYYYLNSILYAQRKDVIDSSTISTINYFNYKAHQNKTHNNLNTLTTSSPTNILTFGSADIRPFWGFKQFKKINDSKHNVSADTPLFKHAVSSLLFKDNSSVTQPFYIHEEKMTIGQTLSNSITNIVTDSNNKSSITNNQTNNQQMPIIMTNQTTKLSNNMLLESKFPISSSTHFDWEDRMVNRESNTKKSESGVNLAKKVPNKSSTNIAASVSFPGLSLTTSPLKSEPVLVLQPRFLPGSMPVTTLYKKTEYMFGRPILAQSAYFLNPNVGAVLKTTQNSLYPNAVASQNSFTKVPYNTIYYQNYQSYNKQPLNLNDMFNAKNLQPSNSIISKLKRNDVSEPNEQIKNLVNSSFLKELLNNHLKLPNNISTLENDKQISNSRHSLHSKIPLMLISISYPYGTLDRIKDTIINSKSDLDSISDSTTPSSLPHFFTTSEYSLRIDETKNINNLMQPSLFYSISNDNNRNKWLEEYLKIKNNYLQTRNN